jgi:hypothetical protein
VTGKVTDEGGKPIRGAIVRTWNDRASSKDAIHRAVTGPDGVYRLHGCEARAAKIVVSSPGHAIDVKALQIEAEMKPLDFQMKRGGTIRIRVVDERDRPIFKARLLFQEWRHSVPYFEFNEFNRETDSRGIWEFQEAPFDEIKADIDFPGRNGFSLQSLRPRNQEYVFRLLPASFVSGTVVDRRVASRSNSSESFQESALVVVGSGGVGAEVIRPPMASTELSGGRIMISRKSSASRRTAISRPCRATSLATKGML